MIWEIQEGVKKRMLAKNDLESIVRQLEGAADSEEIYRISFAVDTFGCGDGSVTYKHIDIDYVNGHFIELREEQELYQHIFSLCKLQEVDATAELQMLLYQQEDM